MHAVTLLARHSVRPFAMTLLRAFVSSCETILVFHSGFFHNVPTMRKELLIAALGIGFTGALDAATRQEVDALLKKIAKTRAPDARSMIAMCYVSGVPAVREEYICPACGTKTLHAVSDFAKINRSAPTWYVIRHRNACKALNWLGWDVKLDESFLCSKCCKPNQPKEFFIEVTIDGKTTRSKIEPHDLTKLLAFASGELIWREMIAQTQVTIEHPLKPELPRIRKLLGVSEEEWRKNSMPSPIRGLLGVFEKKPTQKSK